MSARETPARAKLETMTDAEYAALDSAYQPIQRLAIEVDAKRLARARERRQALDAALDIAIRRACDDDTAIDSLIGI